MNILAEGPTDEAVIRRVLAMLGLTPHVVVLHGKQTLLQRLPRYNAAARHAPWLCVVDLDRDLRCPAEFVADHLPNQNPLMLFRVAVRAIEAWLLADRAACASFLHVSPDVVPIDPELIANPKLEMVNLARRSRSRQIAVDMVPREGSGASEGPAYASRLQEFVVAAPGRWRPEIAAQHAPSLDRCLRALRRQIDQRATG